MARRVGGHLLLAETRIPCLGDPMRFVGFLFCNGMDTGTFVCNGLKIVCLTPKDDSRSGGLRRVIDTEHLDCAKARYCSWWSDHAVQAAVARRVPPPPVDPFVVMLEVVPHTEVEQWRRVIYPSESRKGSRRGAVTFRFRPSPHSALEALPEPPTNIWHPTQSWSWSAVLAA